MRLLHDIEIVDLALYLDSVLVIADVHIGYEEELNKQGILVPRLQFDRMLKRIGGIFSTLKNKNKKIEKIIINGDLKHEFGVISEQEWRNTLRFIDVLGKNCSEIILIRGNHDKVLGPIADKRNIKILEHCPIKNILVCHGDKVPDVSALKKASTIIIGHEHPAVPLREGARLEMFKCFLRGKYKGKNLIVQPSFNTIVEGTNLFRDRILSPFLQQSLGNFDAFVVEDKVYKFGKLKDLEDSL